VQSDIIIGWDSPEVNLLTLSCCYHSERVKLPAHRVGLAGNVDMITESASLPAPAYRQEGGASSRLAREKIGLPCPWPFQDGSLSGTLLAGLDLFLSGL
jgi:hypothetical protein